MVSSLATSNDPVWSDLLARLLSSISADEIMLGARERVRRRQQRSRRQSRSPGRSPGVVSLVLAACGLMILVGCGGAVEEEKEPSVMEDHSDVIFPIMLHDQVIKIGGRSRRLKFKEITDIELHETSEALPDGTRTAIVSFSFASASASPRVKVKITYKGLVGEADENEYGVANFPVTKVEVLPENGG